MGSLEGIVPQFVGDVKKNQAQQKIAVPKVDLTQHNPKGVFQKCTNWQLEEHEFKMEKKIGEGAYGMVYRCTVRGEVCAAKMLKQNLVDFRRTASSDAPKPKFSKDNKMVFKTVDEHKSEVAYKDLIMELDVLVSIDQHPNLVGFRGACLVDEANPIIFEEFVSGPSVKDFFAKSADNSGRPWHPTRTVAYYWIQDLMRGLEFLHNRDPVIIHRDIKPGNLMLSKDLCCLKIGDFGMCKMVPRGSMHTLTHTGHCGTLAYMAPEMYNKAQTQYDEKVDIYSAGIIMWYIATGQGRTLATRPGGPHDVNFRPDLSLVGWPQLESVISRAWAHLPQSRPSASELLHELKRFPERPDPLTPLDFKKAGCGAGCSVQ